MELQLAAGHQVLVRRNPKPSSGYVSDPNILLQPADSLALDTTKLKPGHRVVVRRATKPADGWIKDPYKTLTTETLTIPALSATEPPPDPGEPPPSGELRGFGKTTKRSQNTLVTVNSLAALRTAVGTTGRNVAIDPDIPLNTIWNLGGSNLSVKSGVALNGGNVTFMGGSAPFIAGGSDVFIENVRSHAGDQFGSAAELDSMNLNGNNAPVRRVYFRNCQFLWGPDTNGAILGDVAEVTFERVIWAEGLRHSKHPESGDADGHSLGPNVASEDPDHPADWISFIESMVHTNQSRNFRLIGVYHVELLGCTVYNHAEGPQGCPGMAMILGGTWKKGPNALSTNLLFRAQAGGHGAFSTIKTNTVYESGGQVLGFSSGGVDPKVKASAPLFQTSEPGPVASAAFAKVVSSAGAFPADKQLVRLRANLQNGTGDYVDGVGEQNAYTGLV